MYDLESGKLSGQVTFTWSGAGVTGFALEQMASINWSALCLRGGAAIEKLH
jgi:hypothetical protein